MPAIFLVNQPTDWHAVANDLLRRAAEHPLAAASSTSYAVTEAEAMERAIRLIAERGPEIGRHTAGVVYKNTKLLSLVMTIGPNDVHLSIAEVIAATKLRRLPDDIALEAARYLLGTYTENTEGAIKALRHFHHQMA